jgi:RNA polymerase sigma factor (TIGR02999 family)
MTLSSRQQITDLLVKWSNGDRSALDKLIPQVYDELRRLAHYHMSKERQGHTLQTTALIHEAYERLVDYREMRWQDRKHFFAVAAQVMRRVLVEHARSRNRVKRGGLSTRVPLDEAALLSPQESLEMVALDEALTELEAVHPRQKQVVELRFFGGLSNEEIAEVLDIHPNTVTRDWNLAEAWLRREITRAP